MSIASQITALTTDRNDIRTALVNKGILEASSHGFDDFAEDISNIVSGSGSAIVIVDTPDSHGGIIKEITAVDLAGDTVNAASLLQGYTAHDAIGQPITGVYKPPVKNIVMRPDAEKIRTYSSDEMLVDDHSVTIPAYSTTAKTVFSAVDLSPTITLDYNNYDYFVVTRMLTIPSYSVTSKAKGRNEYSICSACHEVTLIPANSFSAIIDSTKKVTSNTIVVNGVACYRLLYWSSGTAVAIYSASTYGIHQVVTAPVISSGVMTVKSPSVYLRGSTTYLTSTYYNALTDIRLQYVIDVYRAPKNNLNLDGWGSQMQLNDIMDCVNNNNMVLT